MSALRDIGLSSSRLGYALAAYAVVGIAACLFAYRRGGRALLLTTLGSLLAALSMFGGGLWLLSHPPALLARGQALAASAGAGERAWALASGQQVLVLGRPAALLWMSLWPLLVPGLFTSLSDMARKQLWAQWLLRGQPDQPKSPIEMLSDRELEVFRLLGQGKGVRLIGEELGVTIPTVNSFRNRIKDKLQLKSSTEVMLHAIQWVREESAG